MARITSFDSSKSTHNPMVKARRKVGEGLSMVNDFTSNEAVSTVLTSEANKLWRAKILLDRITRPGPKNIDPKVNPNKGTSLFGTPTYGNASGNQIYLPRKQGTDAGKNREFSDRRRDHQASLRRVEFSDGTEPRDVLHRAYGRKDAREGGNNIIVYNLGVSPAQYLAFQTVPKEIDFQNESTWAVINSMGRNTPMYHFTGAETQIQMNISWYCDDKTNPQEVVTKCRLLEAWSKANGYMAGPPVLRLQWGRSDLFSDQLFILTAATYKLANWRADAKVWDKKAKKLISPAGYEDPAMYPATATQELIFRRVSGHNLSYDDIVPKAWLSKISVPQVVHNQASSFISNNS